MDENKSNQTNSGPTEPRLRSFLRTAEAIIAAEKGLNAESRLKLQTLADHLKLPQSLFDEALTQLQEGPDLTSNLTRYEEAFVKFLDAELEKIAGDIISPIAKNQAIAIANSRFGINSTRAEQLVTARADAAGMSLISPLEAESFAENLIVDRVGKLTAIDDELYDQLYRIGRTWGLSQSQVDRIADREVARNKADQKPQLNTWVASLLVGLVVAAALIGSAFAVGWIPQFWVSQSEKNNSLTGNDDSIPASRFPSTISDRLDEIRKANTQLRPTIENLSSDDQLRRRSGYQQLVSSACAERGSNRILSSDLTCVLFYADPDQESALAVLSTIEDLLLVDPNEPPSVQNLKNAFAVNKLLGQLKYHETDADPESELRRKAVDAVIGTLVDIPLNTVESLGDYIAISETEISTDQWNRVMQTAWSSPTQAAVLLQPLYELTISKLEPETLDTYRYDTLTSIMETDASRWRVLQTQIRRAVQSCDDARLIEWVSIFESSEDVALRDLLAEVLVPRIGVQPASQSREDIATAIEKFGLEIRNQVLSPVIERNKLLDRFFTNTLDLEAGNVGAGVSPDRIAQVALAVNVEWAFCAAIEDATHIDDSSFAEFDRLISMPSPRLRQLISLPIDRRTKNAVSPTSATASDRRRMNTSLERLRDFQPSTSSSRGPAIRQLKQIAHRFEAISYSEAEILAGYFLSDLNLEELLNAEKEIEAFAHWPNLLLAIADQLPDSNVDVDQVLTISRLLLNRNFEIDSTADWKRELQAKILAAVSNDVANQVDQDPNNVKSNWVRLKIYLADVYRERLALSSIRGSVNDAYPTPHQVSARLVEAMAEAIIPADHNVNLKRAIRLVHTSTANEVEKTAFANQLLIQIIVDDLSDTKLFAEAARLLANLKNRLREPTLAGDQLYATELTLLQVVNLKRKSLVQRLLHQDKRP